MAQLSRPLPSVLVVDDDDDLRDAIADQLRACGFDVSVARDGDEAFVQLLQPDTCDVVLLDLQMPRVSGRALIEVMRAHFPRIPVLAMTAFDAPRLPDSIALLKKPFRLEQLLDALKAVQDDGPRAQSA